MPRYISGGPMATSGDKVPSTSLAPSKPIDQLTADINSKYGQSGSSTLGKYAYLAGVQGPLTALPGMPGELQRSVREVGKELIPESIQKAFTIPKMKEPKFPGDENRRKHFWDSEEPETYDLPTREDIQKTPAYQWVSSFFPKDIGKVESEGQRRAETIGGVLPLTLYAAASIPAAIIDAIGGTIAGEYGSKGGEVLGQAVGLPKTGAFLGGAAGTLLGTAAGEGAMTKGKNIYQEMKGAKPGLIEKAKSIPAGFAKNSFRRHIKENVIDKGEIAAREAINEATPEWRERRAPEVWEAIKEARDTMSGNTALTKEMGETIADAENLFLPTTPKPETKPLSSSEIAEEFPGLKAKQKEKFIGTEKKAVKKQQAEEKLAFNESNAWRKAEEAEATRVLKEEQSRKETSMREFKQQRVSAVRKSRDEKVAAEKQLSEANKEVRKSGTETRNVLSKERKAKIAEEKKSIRKNKKELKKTRLEFTRNEIKAQIAESESKISKIKEDANKEMVDRRENRIKLKEEATKKLQEKNTAFEKAKSSYNDSKETDVIKPPKLLQQEQLPRIEMPKVEAQIAPSSAKAPINVEAAEKFENKAIDIRKLEKLIDVVGHKYDITRDKKAKSRLKFIYNQAMEALAKAGQENPKWGVPAFNVRSASKAMYQSGVLDGVLPIILGSVVAKGLGLSGLAASIIGVGTKVAAHKKGFQFGNYVDPLRYTEWAIRSPVIRAEMLTLFEEAAAIKFSPKEMRPEHIATAVRAMRNIDQESRKIEMAVNSSPKYVSGGPAR